ncbi:MAG: hypothetical protein ACI3W5_11065 [Faecousia sp.]
MKSFTKLITLCTIVFGICFGFSGCGAEKDPNKSFSLKEYSWAIEQYPSDKKVGSISNSEEAIASAKSLWDDEYGNFNGKHFDLYIDREINVKYDSGSGCWLVYLSTTRTDILAEFPYAIIHKDGDVRALWLN